MRKTCLTEQPGHNNNDNDNKRLSMLCSRAATRPMRAFGEFSRTQTLYGGCFSVFVLASDATAVQHSKSTILFSPSFVSPSVHQIILACLHCSNHSIVWMCVCKCVLYNQLYPNYYYQLCRTFIHPIHTVCSLSFFLSSQS